MRKRSQIGIVGFAVALVTAGALASVALAQPFFGTGGDDVITGTDHHDYITGRTGNDTLNALGRADLVLGGRGNDTVNTGDGNDLAFGGYDDDSVNGELGNDRVFANRGVDTVTGGPGNDHLWARAPADVTGEPNEPADTLDGGEGNDVFHVRDGEADHVTCGAGYDVVRADRKDVVTADCEVVKRHGPQFNRGHKKDRDD